MPEPMSRDDLGRIMGEALEDSLGAGEALTATVDPAALGRGVARALLGVTVRPWRLVPAAGHAAIGSMAALAALGANAAGIAVDPPLRPDAKDRRFDDPAWRSDLRYQTVLQGYLLASRLLAEAVDAAPMAPDRKAKANFGAGLVSDALSPTNFLVTNPVAMRRAVETRGSSLVRGARNLLEDLRTNGGWPRQVDTTGFRIGEELAPTAGKVVFRNDLCEVMQYEPTTPQVRRVPLLMCPPWINRYYIMDLAPGRSLIRWAVDHGFTTFTISYRNADSSMRDLTVEDYLVRGPRRALEVVRSITGSEAVSILGVCMGGTLNAAMQAYGEAVGDPAVASATYLNSAIDFADAGTFGTIFADAGSLDVMEARAVAKGYLAGADLAKSFDLMRANDLIFNYLVSRWLLGEDAPALDLLAWNDDSTNVPVAMHAPFLRACYVRNDLARGEMEVGGHRLLPSKVRTDTYIVSAVADHLVPWQSSYRSTQVLGGDIRFVLSSAGHIAGIVNPPNPKARLWTNPELPADPAEWLRGAQQHETTWWEDWISWLTARSGPEQDPPPMGNVHHPVLGDAPGTYVRS